MKIFSNIVGGIKRAVGWNQLTSINRYLFGFGKEVVADAKQQLDAKPQRQKLQGSKQEIARASRTFKKLLAMYLVFAAVLLVYGIVKLVTHDYWSVFICIALITLCLSQAFRYHFWLFQIRKGVLGCTFDEWFRDLSGRGK